MEQRFRFRQLLPRPETPRNLLTRARFFAERLMLRGARYRLLAVAMAIGAISVAAGYLAFEVDQDFTSTSEAVWWAFLRLTDPGYLGDDKGALKRAISTVVTVLGYVIFLGALVAIMTQWLHQTLNAMAAGYTPIVAKDHVAVVGWNNRTALMMRELFLVEGRVKRFLRRRGARRRSLRVALLVDERSEERYRELRERLGKSLDYWDLAVRTGTPLRLEHLHRVDFSHAAAILLAGDDNLEPTEADGQTIKTLLAASSGPADGDEPLPLVVCELFDAGNVGLARQAYRGPLETIATDRLVARVLSQNLRHPGLSHVHAELLSYIYGSELYAQEAEELVGLCFWQLGPRFPRAIPVGVLRRSGTKLESHLVPDAELVVEEGDLVVLIAPEHEDTEPIELPRSAEKAGPAVDRLVPGALPRRRVLLLGWNHRAPALLSELSAFPAEPFDVTVFSTIPVEERLDDLRGYTLEECLRVEQVVGDYARQVDLEGIAPSSFDSVIILASDRPETDAHADARTMMGLLVLRNMIRSDERRPHVIVELLDPQNATLIESNSEVEVLVTPMLVSHALTLVALRRELRVVIEELFGSGGAELAFFSADDLGLPTGRVTMGEVQAAGQRRGVIAIGVRLWGEERAVPGVFLNPPLGEEFTLCEGDEVVVLTRYDA